MKKLNLGCGSDLRKGWDNADTQLEVPMSFDFDVFPYPIKDNTYEYVLCRNVLCCLKEPKRVLDELWRICKPNAEIEILVPHYHNKGAYAGLENEHYFSENSFINYEKDKIQKENKFEIIKLKVIPTQLFVFLPQFLIRILAIFFGGIAKQVYVRFRVLKEEK